MQIRCIIVDDEPLARLGMQTLVETRPELQLVGIFENAIEAGAFLNQTPNVDLMFLDIQMPGISGMDFLRMLPIKPLTILCTAHTEFAISAFELDVVNYLMKPIQTDKFHKAIDKTVELIQLLQNQQKQTKTGDDEFISSNLKENISKCFTTKWCL